MTLRLKGFIFAALSLIAICAAATAASFGSPGGAIVGAVAGSVLAPLSLLVFGLPAHLGLRHFGRTSLRAHLWTGFAIAAMLAFAGALTLPHGGARMVLQLFEIALILICGPCAALVFWLTVRPDRAAPPA